MSLTAFQHLKTFLMRSVETQGSLTAHNWEELAPGKRYLTPGIITFKRSIKTLQNCAWARDPFKVAGKPMYFNVTGYEMFSDTDSGVCNNWPLRTLVVEYGCDVKEWSHLQRFLPILAIYLSETDFLHVQQPKPRITRDWIAEADRRI